MRRVRISSPCPQLAEAGRFLPNLLHGFPVRPEVMDWEPVVFHLFAALLSADLPRL